MKEKDYTSKTVIDIVNSSIELFNEFGYAGASINDIAKKAGFSKGILYHYFQNKDALYLFCLKKSIDEFMKFMDSNMKKDDLEKSSLLEVVELRFNFFDLYPQYKNLFHNVISNKPVHLTNEISEIRQVLTENNAKIFQSTSNIPNLGKGVSEKDAVLFVTILQNSTTFLLDSGNSEEKRQEVINSIVRLTSIFLNGMKEDLF